MLLRANVANVREFKRKHFIAVHHLSVKWGGYPFSNHTNSLPINILGTYTLCSYIFIGWKIFLNENYFMRGTAYDLVNDYFVCIGSRERN